MKISAIDIRKHTFEKIFRGYDPDAVDAFLNSLSQEWERYTSENRQLKAQLEHTEKELAKLKDIESSLFRTLKTAEETGRQIEREAQEEASIKIESSRVQADEMLLEAEQRTQQVVSETETRLHQLKEDFLVEIKNQERDFRAIENYRDNLIVQLSSLANSTMETVERFEQKYDKESVVSKLEDIKKHVALVAIPPKDQPVLIETFDTVPEVTEETAMPTSNDASEEIFMMEVEEETAVESFIIDQSAAAQPEQPQPTEEDAHESTKTEGVEESSPGQNKFRSQEPAPPKEQSGGSFFDQI